MSQALKNVNTKNTPQRERVPGKNQVRNSAGGFVFEVSEKTRLERFLILGTDKGTYYASQKDLTNQNFDFVRKLAESNVRLLVDTTVSVSDEGRAAKNSPAIFALAVALTFCKPEDKAYVRAAVGKVARTATHLFEFAQYLENLGGWGRAKRAAIADWYEGKSQADLAYQAVKYRQRNGWTHRDLFRLAHPKGVDRNVGEFILGKSELDASSFSGTEKHIAILSGFKALQQAQSVSEVNFLLRELRELRLPWEVIPTQFLNEASVWKTLFEVGAIGQTALLRNVTRLAKNGAFSDLVFAKAVADRLADTEAIRKGRVHPIAYLNALGVYRNGRLSGGMNTWGGSRQKDWNTTPVILGALEDGYYNAFGTIEPANKRYRVAIDTSGSMTWWGPSGLVGLDCREAAAAFAMTLIRSEPYTDVIGFGTSVQRPSIGPKDSLELVQQKINRLPAAGTDCALPMLSALQEGTEIDTFVVVTDNETWAGRTHPFQALRQYRDKTGIDAKLVVVGMTATDFTIADPNDAGMLDVVGFDANAPKVIADFSK